MRAARKWQGPAAIGSTVALLAGAAALAPGASIAATTHNCGTKSFTIERKAESGLPASKFKVTVNQITTHGVSCHAAESFLKKLYASSTGVPEKYKCASGHFKVPPGKVPEVCTRSGKKIQFAGQGG
jgi:hypothetical protein